MKERISQLCKTHLPKWAIDRLRFAKSTSLHATKMSRYAAVRTLTRGEAARTIRCLGPVPIPAAPHEIRTFMVVRNESLRLPFILDHYFAHGVDRIFVMDNNSTDNTADIVLSKRNTHLFVTDGDYTNQEYWIDLLLRRYGIGHWCLIVDADEVFVYPHYETLALRDLCTFMDQSSFNCFDCVLLDMYPGVPLSQAEYQAGNDPLTVASWFDKPAFHEASLEAAYPAYYLDEFNVYYKGPVRLTGGMRKRVFEVNACISKFPLVKFDKSMFLSKGTHFIQGGRASDMRGVLLHFKFLQDFADNVEREVARKQHYQNAAEYKSYLAKVEYCRKSSLTGPLSEEYTDSNQLVSLGIMRSSKEFELLTQTVRPSGLQVRGGPETRLV